MLSTTLGNLQLQNHTITSNVATVRGRVEEGTQIVREETERSSTKTNKALQDIHIRSTAAVIGILGKVGRLSPLAVIPYAKINEIYKILLFLRSNLPGPDTRHTYFQEPTRLEVAYGRIWPVEYDFAMMEGVLRGKFRKGPGKRLVERDMWQLFETSNAQSVLSASNWWPLPGLEITMAMMVPGRDNSLSCPRLNCSSNSFNDTLGGGKRCAT
ncbi:hypothetical protein BKA61DRAFT_68580 [Leptodontidium sp. MPI-SDFR-AT-0119]|nr:hypothetical protein BKA61DRAFT_68580 [Leptodontidium sp. MPI-SDFR-AT-0119]